MEHYKSVGITKNTQYTYYSKNCVVVSYFICTDVSVTLWYSDPLQKCTVRSRQVSILIYLALLITCVSIFYVKLFISLIVLNIFQHFMPGSFVNLYKIKLPC
jgi:uncharacterized membrane protein